MLPGDAAAHGDRQLENFSAELFGPLYLLLIAGIKQNQRMQVAVTGVKDIGNGQSIFPGQAGYFLQHMSYLAARYGAVHAVVVR